MDINEIKNYRQIKAEYINPTNHRPARIKIYEPKRFSEDRKHSVTISCNNLPGDDMGQQVLNYLIANGFNPVSRASEFGGYTFLCDNWAEDFKTLD
mgnify:FL=1